MIEKPSFIETFYPLDLGSDVRAKWMLKNNIVVLFHRASTGSACGTAVVVAGRAATHELSSGGPDDLAHLTISPNIVCGTCRHSGFIEEGKWIPF